MVGFGNRAPLRIGKNPKILGARAITTTKAGDIPSCVRSISEKGW
jgi:hypothetical protein